MTWIPCRWCGERLARNVNPNGPPQEPPCTKCGAVQTATAIPTRCKEFPLISLWFNPDKSVFFEVVHAPPEGKDYRDSKVWRYTISGDQALEFEQHPMGYVDPSKLTDEPLE